MTTKRLRLPRPNSAIFERIAVPLACTGIADLFAKLALAGSLVPGERRAIVPHVLDVTYVENTHGAMGLFGDRPALLVVLTIAVLVLLGFLSHATLKRSAFAQVGFGLVAGGALGNVVDRLAHGYVIDFISLSHFFVFNVADVAVTLGVVLIAAPSLSRERASVRA